MISYIKRLIYRPIGIYRSYLKVRERRGRYGRLFLLNIPSHGNLGDHLISVAEQKFFEDNFPDKELVLVSSADLYYSIRVALLDVRDDDVLCVTGGGFLGSLYAEEKRFLKIIKRFPNNKIVFFPQTVYYESTVDGEKQIESASKIYSAHQHIYFMARDNKSYELLTTRLMPNNKNRVFLVPDIALYLHIPQDKQREYVVFCLRHDAENNKQNELLLRTIEEVVKNKDLPEIQLDTYVSRSISIEDEHREVQSFAGKISRARLVITDRLHGMIYSLITNTPVLALDNISHKVSQVYNLWLADIPFVKLANELADLSKTIDLLLEQHPDCFDNCKIRKMYRPIIDAIND